VLQALSLLVRAVGDRLGVLPPQVGDEPGQEGLGVLLRLASEPECGERRGELDESFQAASEDLWRDLGRVEECVLA
jgi:hypothetical protein